jgi:hypothetical protein
MSPSLSIGSISIGSLFLHSQHLPLHTHHHKLGVVKLLDTTMMNPVLRHNLAALVDQYTIVARQFDPCKSGICNEPNGISRLMTIASMKGATTSQRTN